jgi:hypothetical protein
MAFNKARLTALLKRDILKLYKNVTKNKLISILYERR